MDNNADVMTAQEIARRLEQGDVVHYPRCPFSVPTGDDHSFLLEQRSGLGQKNVRYSIKQDKTSGFHVESPAQSERMHQLMRGFSRTVSQWLTALLPDYVAGLRKDDVTYRPEQEHGRSLPKRANNELLHVDAFPSRPTNGDRILRVFVNVNPADPRVWMTSWSFPQLFEKYGKEVGLPRRPGDSRSWLAQLWPWSVQRSDYDAFMLRFHDFMKFNDDFQRDCPKRMWFFAPGSCWLAMTDSCSHAVISGRYALEHSFFVRRSSLVNPAVAPAALLDRACGFDVAPTLAAPLRRAA